MGLNYAEKLKFAELVAKQMDNHVPEFEIISNLEAEGFNKWDIEKIKDSAKLLLRDQIGDAIRTYMLEGNLEDHLEEFDDVDDEDFEKIQYEQIEKIRNQVRVKVREQLKEGVDIKVIENNNVNDFFTKKHLNEEIDRFNYFHLPVNEETKKSMQMRGFFFICVGIVLTVSSYQFFDRGYFVFYGLIAYGIWCIIHSNSTPSDINDSKRNF